MTIPSPIISPRWSAYSEPRDIKIGISDPTNGYGAALIQSLDRFTGRKTHVVNIFVSLDQLYQAQIDKIVSAKPSFIPMVTVEPKVAMTPEQLASFWAYIATIGPCYVRFAHEMNGNWYPSWGQLDPQVYRDMWDIFFYRRSPNALRVWCVNNGDVGSHKAEDYYPGDDQVDLVGIDGYNKTTQTPAQVFDPMLARLRAITSKPLGICEWGTINSPNKGQWITQFYDYVIANNLSYVAGWNADRPLAYGIFGQSGGNTTFETHPAFLEYAQAVVKLDSRYK